MKITGTAHVTCPACGREHDVTLVQSVNTQTDPDAKQKLLAGELDVLACECGKRTQLVAELLYVDPVSNLYIQVAPTDDAMAKGEQAFASAGAAGTQRLVPSLNALVEKIKIADAGLEDWVIEMIKVLLLASRSEPDLNAVLLFDRVENEVVHWVMLDAGARAMQSPLAAYEKLASRTQARPKSTELRIDRVWAITAVQTMMRDGN
ncbi:MAG TPA: CpXC domain-containing protein [Kofleriaceae bacterium]|nr:CpXC domain-containing protein [Kofleriaceae bacterium]